MGSKVGLRSQIRGRPRVEKDTTEFLGVGFPTEFLGVGFPVRVL